MSERCRQHRATPDSPQAAQRFTLSHMFTAVQMALVLGLTAAPTAASAAPQAGTSSASLELSETVVEGVMDPATGLPPAYAGGQVASGSRVGLLGNKDFMETPFNTISYTDEYIQNRQAQDIGSVIGATDPSVYVPTKRSNFETFFIRGFYSNADDITFNGLVGMAPNMRGSTELAERIEVLKGPSALLNGMPPSGSVGGSINLVPKRAGDEPLARLTTTYESRGLGGVHADLGQRFGDQKQFGVRFNGVYRDGDTPWIISNTKWHCLPSGWIGVASGLGYRSISTNSVNALMVSTTSGSTQLPPTSPTCQAPRRAIMRWHPSGPTPSTTPLPRWCGANTT